MPSVGDVLEVVDLLQVAAITCDEVKCVAVRNRNSRCRKCAEACLADAIEIDHNEIRIDASACVNCGCCVAACPTSAMHAVEPSAAKTKSGVIKVADAATGLVAVACARKDAKKDGDPERYAVVPCLGHIGEGLLVQLVADGYDDIVLVDGHCASCKFGAASPLIDKAVEEAAKLLEAAGTDAVITRTSEFPPEIADHAHANHRGKSRRGILRQTGSYVKAVAGNVANKALEERLGGNSKEPVSLRERLGAGKSGRIPPFQPTQNYQLIDDLSKLLERRGSGPDDQGLRTRHFGTVSIDADRCSGCGMCALFCPTEALRSAEFDEPATEGMRYLEFQASDCTQCMLCKDVCLRTCLEVDPVTTTEELLDFEPRLIEIPKPKARASILDLKARNDHRGAPGV